MTRAMVAGALGAVTLTLGVSGCAVLASLPPLAPLASEVYKSDDFLVVTAARGDTAETLAARYLNDPGKGWMIEDWAETRTFRRGQRVVIPLKPWNLSGVDATGYQLVPILVYHNLGPQAKGRMILGASGFEQQLRYLKKEGYRVVSLRDFIAWTRLERQLPRKAVVLTFDDGYRAFREYAYPLLKELGFTATLFVYTDYVGAGRNALTWDELKAIAAEGFDIEAHSKTHADLARGADEPAAQYARRMQAELADPIKLFQRYLGQTPQLLAYPYGHTDNGLASTVKAQGYVAAFTVRREGSPSFVPPLLISRTQIYADLTLDEFVKNLNVYHHERLR